MLEKMRKSLKQLLIPFSITLPLVFILVFLGYFPVNFDVVLHTDNIKGEGICQTYVCPTTGFAGFYNITFYFGSELHKATIVGYHYDADPISLIVSDVSEFEITTLDSYIHGIHTGHFEASDILGEGETLEGKTATLTTQNGSLHVDVNDPDVGTTITISQKFVPLWFWALYFGIIVVIALLLAVLLKLVLNRVPALNVPLISAATIAATLISGCFFCGSLPYVTYKYFLLNWLFLFAISLLINALTIPCLGTAVTSIFTIIWYIANYYVITLRSKPIMPADLKAVNTAVEVMGGYTFTPSWKMIVGVLVVACYIALLIISWKKYKAVNKQSKKNNILVRIISIAAAVILIVIGINTQTFKSLESFAWDMVLLKSFHEEGMLLTYMKSAFNSQVKKPDGYSREKVEEYLSEYSTAKDDNSEGTKPQKIIMVMNEAFSDLRTVGMDEHIDVMPFIDSLKENTIEGDMYVSVFGGGTCNTEFEALTGNTLAFLGAGAYPYTENVTDPLFSLASYFSNNGYQTTVFHANTPQNWNRNMVYPNLGFDKFYSISDYESLGEVEMLHDLPADIADYNFIENEFGENKDNPQFMFDVTMQNHSGYERWLDVEKAETVAENGSDLYVDTQIYLSLIKASDDEIKQLVEYCEKSDTPTMIIFFGDHQPGLPQVAINEIYTDVEAYLDLYKTKFFIWTNYGTTDKKDVKISANYLPWMILEQGGFDLPPYFQMLKEVYEKYPVISSQGVMDAEGNVYGGVAELMDDPLIQRYQYVQYANLFDEINPAWF